jgi:hypothetical protein
MGVLYLLTGKTFGKDIFEIDYTDDLQSRTTSDKYGFPFDNKILLQQSIDPSDLQYCREQLHTVFSQYHISDTIYRVHLKHAEKLLLNFIQLKSYIRPIVTIEEHSSKCIPFVCF